MIFKMNKKSDNHNPINWTSRIIFKASIGLILAIVGYILLPNIIKNTQISHNTNNNCVGDSVNSAEIETESKPQIYKYKYLDLNPILPPSGSLLTSLAIPRVSGSEGNLKVRFFIKSKFPLEFWDVEEDVHVIDSLHGPSTSFTNLIFTFKNRSSYKNDKDKDKDKDKERRNRNIDRKRTILSAHYDSKLLEAETEAESGSGILSTPVSTLNSEFIGASDSVWSCALLIAIAQAITLEVEAEQGDINPDTLNLQIIFFDGEEAVRHWSSTDSLYGSRALAHKWSQLPPTHPNSLSNISVLVLLDLLGTLDGKDIYSFHPDGTEMAKLFEQFITIESNLQPIHYKHPTSTPTPTPAPITLTLFQTSGQFKLYNGQVIEDDHTPFLAHKVPVLHLIPIPFPKVWHTLQDTLQALDPQVCEHLAIVIYEFVRQRFMN